jgi:hypothetical protein
MVMRVLVACEYSGVVRDAFLALGHDAMSCDLLPTEVPGPHYEGDVMDVIGDGWDLMIAHPPCTYLTNAGVRHLHSTPSRNGVLPKVHGEERWRLMEESAGFFRSLLDAPVPRIAIENPTPHGYAVDRIGRKYDQAVQPWWFGHGETKRTCLWLKNLPPLMATRMVEGREQRIHLMSPGPNRWKERSRTFTGIAEAMAQQWGGVA